MASFACVALWPLPLCPLLGLERVRMPSRTGIGLKWGLKGFRVPSHTQLFSHHTEPHPTVH
eukprot:8641361-Lingulodinium_polyedra.AAC.1